MTTTFGGRALAVAVLVGGLALSCGPRAQSADVGAGMVGPVDTSQAGLLAFARSGAYRMWPSERAPHRSAGPHRGMVRTFMNDTLRNSMSARNEVHPRGSIAVKELYEGDGTTIYGYAIDVKFADGAGANTWVFYEGFGPDYVDPYYGIAHPTCDGCHAGGRDYVLTTLPE